MDTIPEKTSSSWDFLTSNPLFTHASDAISSFQDKRSSLGLPNPGTIDRLSKEVESDVFLNNFSFTGIRADITKTFSGANPLFQVSHQLAMGTQSQPPYAFAVMYGSPKVWASPIDDLREPSLFIYLFFISFLVLTRPPSRYLCKQISTMRSP
jgi:mitochondrial import receptor subunit TOM40